MTELTPQMGADVLLRWINHPAAMVEELFETKPDEWQVDVLEAFPHKPRIALKSAAGTGKSAVLSWLSWNVLLTRSHPWIGATSITGPNLASGLWREMARWRAKASLLESLFEMTNTQIFSREHPKTWRMDARTWAKDANPEQMGDALRGPHAEYIMWAMDETGSYPPAVMPVCENIFSGNPKEAHIIQAGNPTSLTGPLHRACFASRDLWFVVEITGDPDDPKRSPRISLEHAKDQIRQYGRDNPWVRINILGQFPLAGLNSLIDPETVREAMKRMYRDYDIRDAARVIAADVARQGLDQSVIAKRQGLQMFPLIKYRNLDGIQGGSAMVREWDSFKADACFVDATGGFGWSWIDQARRLGKQPIPVEFSGHAHMRERFYNKRAEMALDFAEWIKSGGALPDDERLFEALVQTTYTHAKNSDRLVIIEKDQLKDILGWSPDEMDAAMMTLAEPVTASTKRDRGTRSAASPAYDPFGSSEGAYTDREYNPFPSFPR